VVTKIDKPKTWRLTCEVDSSGEGEEREEVVMRLQGILCNKDLPPITNKHL
jgi:hypothetical protein